MKDPLDAVESGIDRMNARGLAMLKQILMDFLQSLIRPIATSTEVLYRHDFGERYFANWNRTAGVILIALAMVPPTIYQHLDAAVYRRSLFTGYWSTADWANVILGAVWFIAFIGMVTRERHAVRRRYASGTVWHSYCHGVSTVDNLIPEIYHGLIILAAGVVLAFAGLYSIGALAILSGYISAGARKAEMHQFHNQVLDAIDARIESENLSKAIMQRSKPAETEGFSAPLPAYVSDKFRERFAKAITPSAGVQEPAF